MGVIFHVISKANCSTGLGACGGGGTTSGPAPHRTLATAAASCAYEWTSWASTGLIAPSTLASLGNPQRLWRNLDTAAQFFSAAHSISTGSGASLEWQLQFDHAHATGGQRLRATATARTTAGELVMLKQFLRPLPR